MKKLVLVFAAAIITLGAYAQSDSTRNRPKMSPPDIDNNSTNHINSNKTREGMNPNQNQNNNQNKDLQNNQDSSMNRETMDNSSPDGVLMKDGKMMLVRNGKTTMMDRDMVMSDGTKIMSNGTIIKNDGSKRMMKEGEYISLFGKTK